MKRQLLTWFLSIATTYAHGQGSASVPLKVIDSIDITRYSGTWYEIARLPNRFQDDCSSDVTATYTLLDNGQIKVLNKCLREDGTFSEAEGRVRRAKADGPAAKLEVRFAPAFLSFLPFVWGDYWIIDLAPDYSHAVIGEPDRKYLWVLGRKPEMEEQILGGILSLVEEQGYSVESLIRTGHTGGTQQ